MYTIYIIISFSIFFFEENLKTNTQKIIIFTIFIMITLIIFLIQIFIENFKYMKALEFIKSIAIIAYFLTILIFDKKKNKIFLQSFFYLVINLEIFLQKEITILYMIFIGIIYIVSFFSIYEIFKGCIIHHFYLPKLMNFSFFLLL